MNKPENITKLLESPEYVRPFRPLPFWSWNDKLDCSRLTKQIEWMHKCGMGGFFMHARSGLITEYLGKDWMECCDACCDKAAELNMDAYMYDENGWPSGFAGGKLLEDENNRDRWLSCETGEYDSNAFVSYEIGKTTLTRASAGKSGQKYLNVYCHVSVSTVDILNPEVVEKFLDLTHRVYKARYGKDFSKKLKGFFTDEPQYFRWNTSYTPMIAEYFSREYGEDILNGLGLLFVEKDGYEEFRYKYWKGMRALMLKNFARKLYDFCEENNMFLTGHYVEESSFEGQMQCCAGVMPFYEYEHIPGIDWLGRWLPGERAVKQVGSVAAQTGRNRILTETFGCCGWDVTPRELKKILDYQYLGGVNVMCHHLFPSSEYGQRKRDYPQHYTPLNPWINQSFRRFNDCYTRLGALIGNSTEEVNVCVLHPITSAYIDYKRTAERGNIGYLEDAFYREMEMLGGEHIPHHYADETLLEKFGEVRESKLFCGKCGYGFVILPTVKNIAKSTLTLLQKFIESGGKLLMLGSAPQYVNGKRHACDLKSNCTLKDIKAAATYYVNNKELRSCKRIGEFGEFVFIINPTDKEQTFTLKAANAKSVRLLDTDKNVLSEPLPLTRTLRAGQSAVMFPCSQTPKTETVKPVITLSGLQRIVKSTQNTFMLDKARFALCGEDYGEQTPLIKIFAMLLDKRYKGTLRLKYEFESKIVPADFKMYIEDMNTLSVAFNGSPVAPSGALENEPMAKIYDGAKFVKTGINQIEVTLNYFQSDSVYYALFGEGVTEGLRNCMVYDTYLESIYLSGDFGVYPVGVKNGQTERTLICDDFILDAKRDKISSLTTQGFATFAGSVTLESEINCPAGGCALQIGGRWQTAVIEINGKQKELLFDTAADISDMVNPGKNTVRVTLTSSLRNLMGPHHFAPADDPEAIGPEHFDLRDSWHNGESPLFRPTYSLVKTEF